MSVKTRWSAAGRWQRVFAVLFFLWLLYVVLSLILVPWLGRQKLQSELRRLTGRPVTVQSLFFNPLGLSVIVRGFSLPDAQGQRVLAFQRLYADFELSSLFRWSLYFDKVELDSPDFTLTRHADGTFTFQSKPGSGQSAAGESKPFSPPPVSVGEFDVSDGHFRFRDEQRKQPQTLSLQPVNLTLKDFTTDRAGEGDNSFQLEIHGPADGKLNWKGHFNLWPFSISGHLAANDVHIHAYAMLMPEAASFRLPSGKLALNTDWHFRSSNGDFGIANGHLTLDDPTLMLPGQDKPVLGMKELDVSGIALDLPARRLSVGNIRLDKPMVDAVKTASGMNLATLLPAADDNAGDNAGDSTAAKQPSWQVSVDQLNVNGGHGRYSDNTLPQAGVLSVAALDARLSQLVWGKSGQFRIQGKAGLADDGGSLSFSGSGALEPFELSLDIQGQSLKLSQLQPWLASRARLQLQRGTLDSKLTVSVSPDKNSAGKVSGSASINDLKVEQPGGQNSLAVKTLGVGDLVVDTGAHRVRLGQVSIDGLNADTDVDSDGHSVVGQVRRPAPKKPASSSASSGPDWRFAVPDVSIKESALAFTDRSVTPPFHIALTGLKGSLAHLDAGAGKPGQLSLAGKVDRYAPFNLSGNLDLGGKRDDIRLQLGVKGYEMSGLTPYTGRYLGYKVQSGQMALDSRVSIKGSRLDSNNRFTADDFYLGDSVDSKDAVSAPIKLGLAVLRDRSGQIELPVDASGDLSDPNVSVRGILLHAISNVLVKAATSPFSVLAGLVGGENLEQVPYPAGLAQANDTTRTRLDKLAKALQQRPQLVLQLTGSASTAEDRQQLALLQLAREIARSEGLDWQGLDNALGNGDFRQDVLQRWQRDTGKDPKTLGPQPTGAGDAQAVQRQRATQALQELARSRQATVKESALTNLASQRASDTKALLVNTYGVDAKRLFLQKPRVSDNTPPGVQLSLATR